MNRIDMIFGEIKRQKEKALIPYVCCGDPSLDFTEQLVLKLAESGADLIELGIPYSDPVADGPTIQKAAARALKGGVKLDQVLSLVARIRQKTQVPLIFMTYYNPIYVTGVESFVRKAAKAGIDGIIVPDLPLEEAALLQEVSEKNGIHLILLAAPTSSPQRLEKIARLSRGFIYCVSVTGVTGVRQSLSSQLNVFLAKLRSETKLPLAVGFGISSPETARQAAELADGVVVGSALVDVIENHLIEKGNGQIALEEVCNLTKNITNAITYSRNVPN